MAQIKNVDGLSPQQVKALVDQGGKFVVYQYAISVLIMSFKRGSDIYFIRPGESAAAKGLGYTAMSFFLGWWGIPWGPIYTIGTIYTNLSGGKDVTGDIMDHIGATHLPPTPQPASGGYNVPGADNGGYNVPGANNNTASNGGYNVPGNNTDSSTGSYNIPR